ncbi:kinase-like domain-containing protein [Rhizophagus clarus]|uniref:Kinase-like domain-containing protein n=1 Tax=Rhizophagus clarus TaxID=94130 RepID=A0A8H3QQH3_9GLOM|nr:kinase-like domain-containing protein [Rhizophagus clarus]
MSVCEECKQEHTLFEWCKACNAKHFQENFKNWTSGSDDIDKLIQNIQLSAIDSHKVLEWIPYNKFYDIEYIAKGGFGKVYRAQWIDGYIWNWDNKNKNWKRLDPNKFVALKCLNNSENVKSEFINEITMHRKIVNEIENSAIVRVYGITRDPEEKNYIMVLQYAENGSLRNYLNKNYDKLVWKNKFKDLWYIAIGLKRIHKNELIHRDLHIENTKNSIYGVLPYIAPEILRGRNYTKAADIYIFGIIMYEVFSGLSPYHDVSHNRNLAIKIYQGLRPRFNIKIPQLIVNLIRRCLDVYPLNRPTAEEIGNILHEWWYRFNRQIELQEQIKETERINDSLSTTTSTSSSYERHSEAVYTSRLLGFNNLPEPKNSDDYYDEQNDNMIKSLQIDLSQFETNKDANENI